MGVGQGEEPTSNKLETPESVHTLPVLQDGGFSLSSKHYM